ncbi:hypothetical protein ABH963_005890 [Bacillus sp. RC55]
MFIAQNVIGKLGKEILHLIVPNATCFFDTKDAF